MGSIAADLPILPAHVEPPPPESAILAQPSVQERNAKLARTIDKETFVDIDPGVFDNELLRQKIYTTIDPDHPENEPTYQKGDITTGTYAGTQAALTHLYRRIERR